MQGRRIFENSVMVLVGAIGLIFMGYTIYLAYNFICDAILDFTIYYMIR